MIRGTLAAIAAALWLAGAAWAQSIPDNANVAVRLAVKANEAAADHAAWLRSPYAPRRLVSVWAQRRGPGRRAACRALSGLTDDDLELFEQALLLSGEPLPCRKALLKRLSRLSVAAAPLPPRMASSAPVNAGRGTLSQSERPRCPGNKNALGTGRVIEVPTGHAFGRTQRFAALHLAPGELVFTFDDGPLPRSTDRVLAVLEAHCVRATFFSVGKMALTYPDLIREVQVRGHVVGSHTWNHELLPRTSFESAIRHIERGRAEIDRVLSASAHSWLPGARGGVAPFFRFPGLEYNKKLLAHAIGRDLSVFSCDICIDDWKKFSDEALLKLALKQIEAKGQGIVLLHDIQRRTARILPALFKTLAARGYRAVHMVPQGWISAPAPRPSAQTAAAPAPE